MQQLFTQVKRRRGDTLNAQVSSDVSVAINHSFRLSKEDKRPMCQ